MKIAYFSSKVPYSSEREGYPYGGSVNATFSLAKEMSRRGHEITIFTTSDRSIDEYEKVDGIHIVRYASLFNFYTSNISLNLFFRPKGDFDLVHVSYDIPPAPFAVLKYLRKKNTPLIVTYHGDWDPGYGSLSRKLLVKSCNGGLSRRLLDRSQIIICPSSMYIYESDLLKEYEGKVQVIPNGVSTEKSTHQISRACCREALGLPGNKNIILFFGNLSTYKGPDVLLESFCGLQAELDGAILIFAGKGEMDQRLRQMVNDRGISDSVIFTGHVPEVDKNKYYRSADIFCLPSIGGTECYPLAILEAMSNKTPVVSSIIGGIPDIIYHRHNGFLVGPNDVNQLKEMLLYVLKNPLERETVSELAFQTVNNLSWPSIAAKTEEIYKGII